MPRSPVIFSEEETSDRFGVLFGPWYEQGGS